MPPGRRVRDLSVTFINQYNNSICRSIAPVRVARNLKKTGEETMSAAGTSNGVNAGARLDRLPFSAFHRRIILLIGTGMFLDACDIYMAPGVLGALVKSGWSDLATNATFLSATFIGMLIGTVSSGLI